MVGMGVPFFWTFMAHTSVFWQILCWNLGHPDQAPEQSWWDWFFSDSWFSITFTLLRETGDVWCLLPRPPAKSQGCHLIPLFCLLSCSSAYYYCSIYWWCHGVWHLSLESTWTPRLSVWPTLKKISQALKYINKLFWKLHHNTKTTFRFLQMIPKLTRRLQLQKYELLPQIVPYHVN